MNRDLAVLQLQDPASLGELAKVVMFVAIIVVGAFEELQGLVELIASMMCLFCVFKRTLPSAMS